MIPGFSERTFEFCYNAEYCQNSAGLLATHPHIPSQRQEKALGYDVKFEFTKGHYMRSLYLQHKVSFYAEVRAGRNADFYAAHNGPYFRFSVDNDQHNVLYDLSMSKGNVFYCAPRFYRRSELEHHFRNSSVAPNTIWLDPLDVGKINDNLRHNITYGPHAQNPTLHSDPRKFKRSYGGGEEDVPEFRRQLITEDYVQGLAEELLQRTIDSKFRGFVPKDLWRRHPVEQVQFLLGRIYQVSWILLP